MSSDVFAVDGVDAIFAADLAGFVAARDALVKQCKAAGDKEGAAAVKALRKPSTAAWGINRIIRTHGDEVNELVAAAADVRAAQARAVQGNDAGGLREASRSWRAKVNQLAAAVAVLVGAQYRDEAAATFEAASVDESLTEALRAGRFTATVTAAGFGLAGMPEPAARPLALEVEAAPSGRVATPEPEVTSQAQSEPQPDVDSEARVEAEERLAQRDKQLERALFQLRRAEQRLDQAREAVDEARLAHGDAIASRDAAALVVADAASVDSLRRR